MDRECLTNKDIDIQNNTMFWVFVMLFTWVCLATLFGFFIRELWGYDMSRAEVALLHNDTHKARQEIGRVGNERAGIDDLINKITYQESTNEGIVMYTNGDLDSAVALFKTIGNTEQLGVCGVLYYNKKDYYNARKCFSESGGYDEYIQLMDENKDIELFYSVYQTALRYIEEENYKEAVPLLRMTALKDIGDSKKLLTKYEKLVNTKN